MCSVLIGLNRVVIGALHILLYLCGTHFLPDRYLLSEEFNVRPKGTEPSLLHT